MIDMAPEKHTERKQNEMRKYLSIVIPARNEELRIRNVEKYVSYFEKMYGSHFEIIVVTDNCTDRTLEILSDICKKHPQVRNLNYDRRLNKGGAVAEGFMNAKGLILTYTDVDGATSPNQLDNLIDVLNIIGCDGVIASRYSGGSKLLVKQSLHRRVLSRGFNFLVKTMFMLPFSDTQCGAKVFKRKVAQDIANDLAVTDWAFDVNILYNAHKKGYDIREIPIVWEDKKGSKLNSSKVVPIMLLSLIRLRLIKSGYTGVVKNRQLNKILMKTGLLKKDDKK